MSSVGNVEPTDIMEVGEIVDKDEESTEKTKASKKPTTPRAMDIHGIRQHLKAK
jgi:hypothetical protein